MIRAPATSRRALHATRPATAGSRLACPPCEAPRRRSRHSLRGAFLRLWSEGRLLGRSQPEAKAADLLPRAAGCELAIHRVVVDRSTAEDPDAEDDEIPGALAQRGRERRERRGFPDQRRRCAVDDLV